jgi:sortase A
VIGWTGSTYARGWLAQERARMAWEAKLARGAVERGQAAAALGPEARPAGGSPVARLVISRIALDDIVLEGVSSTALNGGPGHLPGSVLPGAGGNSIISAHRDRHFRRLGELQIGDTIVTETEQHSTTWVVTSRKVVQRAVPALFETPEPALTLTTCWPIGYLGGAPERLIIKAVPTNRD